MAEFVDRRRVRDRRRQPRGGRRPYDIAGFTPLVYVVDPRPSGREACEAILAKLRFAVAPFTSTEQARRALHGLKPDIVLVVAAHLDDLRGDLPTGRDGRPVPILPLPDGDLSTDALIEDIRRALAFKTNVL
jgi:hypothetical protein